MKKILLVLCITCFSTFNVNAKDYGVVAKTYPVKEESIIVAMKNKMAEKMKNGDWDKEVNKLKKRAKGYVKRPKGINLPAATKYSAERVDVRYRLDKDITDNSGRTLFKAGEIVNPLTIYPMSFGLCFIDGDDKKQVNWANKLCKPKERIVLVNGDYEKVAKQMDTRVYFDQKAYLANRFNLKKLPTVIRQSGDFLTKEEFVAQ